MQYLKITVITSLLAALAIFFSQCFHSHPLNSDDPRGSQYAGTKVCANCHQGTSQSYAHSNHYKTSSRVDNNCIKKWIAASRDRFYFADSSYIHLQQKENGFAQAYFVNDIEKGEANFDIAFGSAEKAQTYGYWNDDKLYQLPLTWFASSNTWANSPGFPGSYANYNRSIDSRCFECHASYIHKESVQSGPLAVTEQLDQSSIVYGIDCERCHGPALSHVKFHQENPLVRTPKYIVSIRSLTRQQQLDLCAVCHSGNDRNTQRSLFAFLPGDTLSHFYFPDFGESARSTPDVHGKQLQLLASSACFKMTDLTCTTCHTPHASEKNRITDFISKCMACHQNSSHAAGILKENEQQKRDFNLLGVNCIDCHMPLQTSKTIYSNNGTGSKTIPYLLRTHKIAIYKQ